MLNRVALPRWAFVRPWTPDWGATLVALHGLYAVLFASWVLFKWAGAEHATAISDIAGAPSAFLAAALALWPAARREDRPAVTRAWRLLGLAFLTFGLGELMWLLLELVAHRTPFPSPADALYLAFYPLTLAGLMSLPARTRDGALRATFLLDAATVLVGGGMLIWFLVLQPASLTNYENRLTELLAVAYPLGDLLLLVGVGAVLYRRPDGSRRALSALLAVVCLFVIADTGFAALSLRGAYRSGDWPDAFWVVATALMSLAAWLQRRASAPAAQPRDTHEIGAVLLLPYLGVAAGCGLLLFVARHHWADTLGSVLFATLALIGVVLLRQVIALRENRRLLASGASLSSQLAEQAFRDPLTRLPNRAWFRDYVERACTRSARHGSLLAVLFLDLDQFKVVNDSLGHEVGDNLLTAAADRLRLCLRPEDAVARLGGDEFAVLLEDLGDPSDAMRVADRLIEALQAPFLVYSHEVFTSASVGIALSECGADHPQDLLRHAEVAMYQAKDLGRSRVEVFDSHMGVRARERLELEADLRRALRGGELRLQYQPLVTLEAGRMVAVEALVRWQHPREGLLSPGRFISLAEETGLITAVGRWVLEESCRQLRRWQDRYPGAPARVCVNVSPRQLRQPTFLQEVTAIVRAARLDPRCLTIEITEGVLMENRDVALPILEGLRRLGVTVAIDDFGTGYSSLAYLRQYPVDILKIDKSFVDDIGDEAGGTALAGAIIHLAQTLRLQIVAEGIERREQAEQLRRLGCHQGQGYYFGRPYPQDAIEAMLSGSSAPSDGESGARPPTAPAPVP